MLLDLLDLKKLRLIMFYVAYLLLMLFFQDSVLGNLKILGVKPLFFPAALVAIGMFENGIWGGALGVFAGILADIVTGYTALFTMLLPAVGFFAGVFSRWFINKRFFAFLIAGAAAIFVTGVLQAVKVWVFNGQFSFAVIFTVFIQAIVSIPFVAPLYYPCKWINERFGYLRSRKES